MAEKTYTVGEAAELSGTSVRALHHYEELGLLVPARRDNGYRSYDSADLARLQQILLYRACGFELSDIKELLDDPGFNEKAALELHLESLLAQKAELETLIATVRKTLDMVAGKAELSDAERFEGLKRAAIEANERQYGAEARERYGDAAVDAANDAVMAMNEEEWGEMSELEIAIIEQLKAAMADGDPLGAAAHQLATMHGQWIRMHWGANAFSREAHRALVHGYLEDARFRAYYDKQAGEGATEFLVAAIDAL